MLVRPFCAFFVMLTPVEDDGESSCSEMLDNEAPFEERETEEDKSAERCLLFVFFVMMMRLR